MKTNDCLNCSLSTCFAYELIDSEYCYCCREVLDKNCRSKTENVKEQKERRTAKRTDYSTEVQYRVQGRPDLGDWTAHLENLSSRGILIFGDSKLHVGDRIEIDILIPYISLKKLIFYGTAVRVRGKKRKRNIAIEFEKHNFNKDLNEFAVGNNRIRDCVENNKENERH